MDPTNTNPDNQAPVNPVAPTAPVAPVVPDPVAPVAPAAPAVPEPVAPAAPVVPEPVAPVEPVMPPVAPEVPAAPEAPVMPEAPVAPATPEAPVAQANPNVSIPMIDPSLIERDSISATAVSDVMVGATDPITMPNPPKAPDPIEEELKAPMTAAAPVPGSIGSAISVPAEQPADGGEMPVNNLNMNAMPQTPSVAFNDPASMQGQPANPQKPAPAKKKMDKKTLILLCGVAGVAVVALVIVLVMMMM